MQILIEVAKAKVMEVSEASGDVRRSTAGTRHPTVVESKRQKQTDHCYDNQCSNWMPKDKYITLKQFEMEVTNISLIKHYEINETEKATGNKELIKKIGAPVHINTDKCRKK